MQAVTAPRSLKEKQRQEREVLILQVAEEVLMAAGTQARLMGGGAGKWCRVASDPIPKI